MLFPVLMAFLFAPGLGRFRTPGVAALAVSLITRFNQAPAILWMLATFLGRGRHAGLRRQLIWSVTFVLLASLPLAHNLYYGDRFVLGTSSATIPENLVINLAEGTSRAELVEAVREQLRGMFYYGRASSYFGGGQLVWVFRGLQIVWCGAVMWILTPRRGRARWLALAAVAPAYLGAHLIYVVIVYYPRHIVVGHLAMGALAILIGSDSQRAPGPSR